MIDGKGLLIRGKTRVVGYMNKRLRSKFSNKFFLFYLLAIFILAGIFASANFNTGNAKIGNPNENYLSTNDFVLDNYALDVDVGYDWIASTASSTTLFLSDDDSEEVSFPFSFQFYDREFTSVHVSSNGWFSFDNTDPYNLVSQTFPTSSSDYYYSGALFMCDLHPVSNVYVHKSNQYVAIEYRDINHYGGFTAGTFEVVFYKSGIIKFQYDGISNLASGQTVGLNYGLDLDYYNSYTELAVTDNDLCLRFTYPGTLNGAYIGIGIAGGLVVIGGVIGIVFFVRYRRTHPKFLKDDGDFPLIYHDYVTLEQEADRLRSPEEKSIHKIQDEIREIYKLYTNKDVILLDVLAEQFQVEAYLVEEAFSQLLASKEIKGKINLIAKEFVVRK